MSKHASYHPALPSGTVQAARKADQLAKEVAQLQEDKLNLQVGVDSKEPLVTATEIQAAVYFVLWMLC